MPATSTRSNEGRRQKAKGGKRQTACEPRRLLTFTFCLLPFAFLAACAAKARGPLAYVTNERDGTITVIDTARDEVVARLKTAEPSTGRVRLTPDGKKAVVGSDSATKVSVFDVQARRLTAEVETGATHKVITVSGDGRRAFLTNPDAVSVTVVDILAGKRVAAFRTGKKPDGIAWAD